MIPRLKWSLPLDSKTVDDPQERNALNRLRGDVYEA